MWKVSSFSYIISVNKHKITVKDVVWNVFWLIIMLELVENYEQSKNPESQ